MEIVSYISRKSLSLSSLHACINFRYSNYYFRFIELRRAPLFVSAGKRDAADQKTPADQADRLWSQQEDRAWSGAAAHAR